jgi:hypothetical protein
MIVRTSLIVAVEVHEAWTARLRAGIETWLSSRWERTSATAAAADPVAPSDDDRGAAA